MNNIWLWLFILCSLVHLFFCLREWEVPRKRTKPLLMPLLLAYYMTGTTNPQFGIILALTFGFLGDVFLLGKELYLLALGLGAFLLGHVCYILELATFLQKIEYHILPIAAVLYAVIFIIAVWSLYKHLGKMLIPVMLYMAVLLSFSLLALHWLWFAPGIRTAAVLLGTLLFAMSDYILARQYFIHEPRRPHLPVMFTYLLAQFLIIYGLL